MKVVDACGGIDGSAVFMTSAGVDHEPTGLDPKKAMVERSVPKKVYKDAMLAWEMNGVPLPNAHERLVMEHRSFPKPTLHLCKLF